VTKYSHPFNVAGWTLFGLAGIAFLAAGCRKKVEQHADEAKTRITRLGTLFGRYSSLHQGVGPPDEKAFKEFIRSMPADQAQSISGLDQSKVDDLFVSPRDSQPYVILYGTMMSAPGPEGAPLIAYEKVGSGGKHYVYISPGKVEEVDDARLNELVPKGR
jgi:hypothetical protein